jgi:serine/threonine-protein kinase
MKVLPPHLTFGKGAVARFRREARTAAALEHPSIVPVYRVAPGGRIFWYTMKYLEGRSLADVLKEQTTLPLPAAVTILERIGNALDYAHQRHVIHRDVKPGNVMLETHGHVIVTDFGIAKEAAAGTLSEAIVGTPFYMSPEQCQGGTLSGASDQYSVAIMAYQMLTGKVPFDSRSVVDLLQKHVGEEPPPLRDLPPHVGAAVHRALAKEPANRFPSVTAFVRALAGPTDDSTVRLPRYWSIRQRSSPRRPAPAATPQHQRRQRVWSAATAVTVAGLGLWVWSSRATGSQASPREAIPRDSSVAATAVPRAVTSTAPAPPPPPVRQPTPAPAAVKPAERALLVVQTVGGWARIYVDGGAPRDGTSYRAAVSAGHHRLHLERPGYRTVDSTVVVGPLDTLVVRVPLTRGGS